MTRQHGFSLVSAIFLMVVLVILGTSMVTISSVQQTTTAQMLQVARANYAARAGAEWAAARSAVAGWCPGTATANFNVNGFAIELACTRTEHVVDAGTQQYFVVDVTASSGTYNGPDYVRRRLRTKLLGPVP
jgi:MSHA biogenesis protein MshP